MMNGLTIRNSGLVWQSREYVNDRTVLNECMYTPSTWAEWTKTAGVVGDSAGLEYTLSNATQQYATFNTALKALTKYIIIIHVISNAMSACNLILNSTLTGGYPVLVTAGQTGNVKATITTQATITNNTFRIIQNSLNDNGLKIKLRDIRVLECPAGSQISTDADTLTADQLNIKYPYAGNCIIDRSRTQSLGVNSNVTWVKQANNLWTRLYNGTTSYTEIPDSPALRLAQGGTLMAWIYPVGLGENNAGRIFDKGSDANSTGGYQFTVGTGNIITGKVNAGTQVVSSASAISLSTHQHVAMTMGASGIVLYVNGVPKGSTGVSNIPPNTSGNIRIGNAMHALDYTFNGYIGGEKEYNRILSAAELLRIYNSEKSFYGL